MNYVRHSAIHGALIQLEPDWTTHDGMRTAAQIKHQDDEAQTRLALADVSFLRKLSVKGPGAATWLRERDVAPPDHVFDIAPLSASGGIISRIGRAEYFLEAGPHASTVLPLFSETLEPTGTAHPMARHDVSLVACGSRVPDLLAQTCGVDIIGDLANRMVLTRLAAVSVMLLYRPEPDCVRIWCDASFGAYLWEAMLDIVRDLGGTAVGAEAASAWIH